MRNQIINFVTLLGVFGIPTIFSMTMYCIKACRSFSTQLRVLMASQQAQMRAMLLKDYKKYIERGWIELEELDDWENQYQSYHLLGANGVLDSKRDDLLKLPNIKQK